MAAKVAKGQICSGTISKIKFHKECYLCEKFHTFFKSSTECPIWLWCLTMYYFLLYATILLLQPY